MRAVCQPISSCGATTAGTCITALPPYRKLEPTRVREPDGERLSRILYRLCVDIASSTVVDLLSRIPNPTEHHHDSAPGAGEMTREPNTLEIEDLALARREQASFGDIGDVARARLIGWQLQIGPILPKLEQGDPEVEVALVGDQLEMSLEQPADLGGRGKRVARVDQRDHGVDRGILHAAARNDAGAVGAVRQIHRERHRAVPRWQRG